MVVFGFIANRLNVGIDGFGGGLRYALHSAMERSCHHAVDCGRGLFDLSRLVAQYFPIFEAHSAEIAPAEVEETEAESIEVA
jgi:hypothetical protein